MQITHGDGYFTPERVTYHAVTRYVQRVLFVAAEGTFEDRQEEAAAHCAAAGTSIEEVRAVIWTPFVCQAIKLGLRNIWTRQFGIRVSDNFSVITVIEPRLRPHQRLRVMSENEAHQKIRRIARRIKQQHPNEGTYDD
jgi:hypothetical protein